MRITVGLKNVNHSQYDIVIEKDTVKIVLKDPNEQFAIQFADDDFSHYHIAIIGRENTVFLAERLNCVGIAADCKSFNSDDNLALTAKYLSLKVDDGEIGGTIRIYDFDIIIKMNGTGIVNYGQIYVERLYKQDIGAFTNKKIFYANAVEITNGGLILNDVNASWHSQSQVRVNGDTFINLGTFSGDITRIRCEIIEIKHLFTCTVSELHAGISLHIDANAKIVCWMQWYAEAKQFIRVEGEFSQADRIRFVSTTVNIAATAKFEKCCAVESVAYGVLKIEAGVGLKEVEHFIANALSLDIESNITTLKSIELDGRERHVIHEAVTLTSALTVLRGMSVFLYGKIRGQVMFPQEHMEHVYFAKSSVIDSCDRLKISANLIEPLGRLLTFDNDFKATFAVVTGDHSVLYTVSSTMHAAFVSLAGKYAATKFGNVADKQLAIHDAANLANGESLLYAPFVSLAGDIYGAVDVKSDSLLTSARIINDSTTKMQANKTLVTAPGSSVTTKDVTFKSKQMLHYGEVEASETADENGADIYHDKASSHTAKVNNIKGTQVAMDGYFEGSEQSLVTGTESIQLLSGNTVAGGAAKLQSANIHGTAQFECESAQVIGVRHVHLDQGESAVKDVLTVAGRDVHLDIDAAAREIQLLQLSDNDSETPAHLNVAEGSNLTADKVVENFNKANIAGALKVKTAVMQSADFLGITDTADIAFQDLLQIQSAKSLIDGKIERAADEANNGMMFVEGEQACFAESSSITSSVPVSVKSDDSVFAGEMDLAVLHNESDNTLFTSDCLVSENSGDIVTVGKTDKAKVDIQHGAMIGGKSFNADKIDEMRVAGTVATKAIKIKGNKLKIDADGKLGTLETKMLIDVSYLTLFGTLEADEAKLKVARAFVQSGFHGPALLRARKLAIDSVFYFNILGRTYAHSATINSLVSLSLALELINYKASNSALSLSMGLSAFHPGFLIEAIKNNNTDFLSPQFLQYSLQSALTILQPFFPTVTLAANTALSAYFLYVNVSQSVDLINELRKKHELGEDIRIVDTLGLLVSMKNAANAGVSVYNNGTALYDALKDKILDNIKDLKDYIGEDLANDIRDKLTPHPDKNDSEHPSVTKDKADADQAKVENNKGHHHKKDDHKKDDPKKDENKPKPAPTTWESWQKWWQELDGYDFAHDTFSKFVVAPLSVWLPSSNEFSLIGGRLGKPSIYFTDTQQGFATFSYASPVVAAVSNKTGWYCLADFDRHFAYTEILNGYHVLKGGDSFAHSYSVYSHDYTMTEGTKVRTGNLYLKEDEITPHDMKGKHNTFECNKVENQEDFFRFVGAYDVMKPDDLEHSSANFRIHDSLKFYHSLQFDCATTLCGDDIFVADGVKLKTMNGSLGLVSTRESIVVNGDLEAKKDVIEDSAKDILHKHATTNSRGFYEHARQNINHTDGSKSTCDEGAIISDRADVTVTGSTVEFKKRGFVKAHDNVKAECTTKDIKTHGKHDVEYTRGVIKGGDEETGLYVEARKIWNVGSYIGATGGYYLKARALEALALTNEYTSEHHHKKKLLGLHDSYRDVQTTRVQRSIFEAQYGQGIVKVDHIKTVATEFDSKGPTIIDTRDAPEFLDIDVHTDTHKSSSLGGVKYKKQHHIEDKKTGDKFDNKELLYVRCRQGNIVFKNCYIKAPVVGTEAETGGTFVVWDKARHFKDTSYLSGSVGVGPFSYSYSFDPDDKHPHKFSFQDPLLDNAKSVSKSKGADGKIASGINAADALAGKLTGPVVPTNVSASVGWNRRVEHYEAMNPDNKFIVNVWHDYSQDGVVVKGVAGVWVDLIDIHRGGLVMIGDKYSYDVTSTSKSFGGSYDPVANRLDANASITGFKAHGRVVAPCQLSVGRLIFRQEEARVDLNDSQLRVHDLHGRVNVNMTSSFSDSTQTMTSASLSTNGNFSVAAGETKSHVPSPTFLEVTDMSHATIHEYNSVGGELRGDGFKNYKPEVVHETKLTGTTHTKSFMVAGNMANQSIATVGCTNTVNGHGVEFTVNTPTRIFDFFAPPPKVTTEVLLREEQDLAKDDVRVNMGEFDDNVEEVSTQQQQHNVVKRDAVGSPQSAEQEEPAAEVDVASNESGVVARATHEGAHGEEHEHIHYLTPHESKEIFGYLSEPKESDFRYHSSPAEPAEVFGEGLAVDGNRVPTSKTFDAASRYPLFSEESWSNSCVYQLNKNYSLYDGRVSPGDIKGATEVYRSNYDGEMNCYTGNFTENPNYAPRLTLNAGRSVYGGLLAGSYLLAAKAAYDDLGSLTQAFEMSSQHHTPRPMIYESSRVAFSWTGALTMGAYAGPLIEAGVMALELSNPVTACMYAGGVLLASNAGGHGGNYASERILRSAEVAADGFYNAGRQIWSNAKFSYNTLYKTGHTIFNAFHRPPPPPPPPPLPHTQRRLG